MNVQQMTSPKEFISAKLRAAVQECQIRGLFSSATWAAEQLMGLDDDNAAIDQRDAQEDSFVSINVGFDEKVGVKEVGAILLGSSLIATAQYQRCAHNLRSEGNRKIQSNLGIFLYSYAQYLAGEKIRIQAKEEKEKRDKTKSQSKSRNKDDMDKVDDGAVNPYVHQLHSYLSSVYRNGLMDSYLLYIFAVITRDLHKQIGKALSVALVSEKEEKVESPLFLFKSSLAHNPWNW